MTTLVFLKSIVGEPHFFLIIPTSVIELVPESCSFSSGTLTTLREDALCILIHRLVHLTYEGPA